VFYQNFRFVNIPSQVSVYQRLQREPKAAKQNARLPRGTSSKSRDRACRKKPQKGNTSSKAEANEGQRRYQKIPRDIPLFYKPATEWVSCSPEYLSPDTLKGTSHYRNSTASLKKLHQILSIRKSLYEKAWTILKERQSSSEQLSSSGQNPSSKQKSFESSDLLEAWMPVMNCGISNFYAAPPWWFKDIEYTPKIGKLTEKGIPQFQ
jgi:hypothetical protein